jgi:hypothetical protein
MLQTDRFASVLDAPFGVPLAWPCKARLKQIMRGQYGKPLGQHLF